MAVKSDIKQSEARILVYLSQVSNLNKDVSSISSKLQIDYGYTLRILEGMRYKKWVFKHKLGRKMFYDLELNSPVDRAKSALSNLDLQEVNEAIRQTKLMEVNDG